MRLKDISRHPALFSLPARKEAHTAQMVPIRPSSQRGKR
jgi:hypothetical protein